MTNAAPAAVSPSPFRSLRAAITRAFLIAVAAATLFHLTNDRVGAQSAANPLNYIKTIFVTGDYGGTPTGAVMAVLDAMGLLSEDRIFTHESLIGTTLRGRIRGRTLFGDRPTIFSEIEATAFITGEHTFLMDEQDPLNEGYVI